MGRTWRKNSDHYNEKPDPKSQQRQLRKKLKKLQKQTEQPEDIQEFLPQKDNLQC